jgi:hypothetical protein
MVVVTVGLLAVVLLKILAVFNAIRWLHSHGPAFAAALAEQPPQSVVDQERLYDRLGADFFPFGIKDYRIRRMARRLRGPRGLLLGWPARVFQVLLFNLALLAVLTAGYLIALASTPSLPDLLARPVHDAIALALALSVIVATMLIAVEAVYGYAVLGSYGLGFHELRPERRVPERALVREFQVFAGALIAAHLAGVGAVYLISHRFEGYAKIPASTPTDLAHTALQVLDCSYYTMATFVGAGDPEPLTAAGKMASGLIAAQGLAFLVLVLASMLSIVGNERARSIRPSTIPQPATSIVDGATEHRQQTAADQDDPSHPGHEPKPRQASAFMLGAVAGAAGVIAVLAWTRVRRRSRQPE